MVNGEAHPATGVCKKALLRIGGQVGQSALKAPNQGLDRSFCPWLAGAKAHLK